MQKQVPNRLKSSQQPNMLTTWCPAADHRLPNQTQPSQLWYSVSDAAAPLVDCCHRVSASRTCESFTRRTRCRSAFNKVICFNYSLIRYMLNVTSCRRQHAAVPETAILPVSMRIKICTRKECRTPASNSSPRKASNKGCLMIIVPQAECKLPHGTGSAWPSGLGLISTA